MNRTLCPPDEPDIVSTIETTPPPFAREIALIEQETTEYPPAAQTDTLVLTAVDTVDDPDPASLPETQRDTAPEEQIEDVTAIALTEADNEAVATVPPAETTPEATEDQPEATVDEPSSEPTEEVTTVALAEASSETAAVESPAETVAEVIEEQQNEIVEPVFPVAKTGDWVINLSSYTWKSTANRKLALFQQQGVDAEVFEVMIKDKPMYRIRVTGFENSRAAKAEIPALEEKLGLEGTWISKR
jgi:cell division protein FtsN